MWPPCSNAAPSSFWWMSWPTAMPPAANGPSAGRTWRPCCSLGERIPNRVLEQADQVVLVDVTPETLQERLLEGKVYAPGKVEQALAGYF